MVQTPGHRLGSGLGCEDHTLTLWQSEHLQHWVEVWECPPHTLLETLPKGANSLYQGPGGAVSAVSAFGRGGGGGVVHGSHLGCLGVWWSGAFIGQFLAHRGPREQGRQVPPKAPGEGGAIFGHAAPELRARGGWWMIPVLRMEGPP